MQNQLPPTHESPSQRALKSLIDTSSFARSFNSPSNTLRLREDFNSKWLMLILLLYYHLPQCLPPPSRSSSSFKRRTHGMHFIIKFHSNPPFPGVIVNGLINVSITTIERRFELKSSQFAPVASGYDFASFCVLIPLTYFGGRATASKPRWIGCGVLLMAVGSLVFALPHFLVGPYRAISGELDVCQTGNEATGNSTSVGNDSLGAAGVIFLSANIFRQGKCVTTI